MDRKQASEEIYAAVLKATQVTGEKAFRLSQTNAPVLTGFLRKSGSFQILSNGCKIVYAAPYASIVENGQSAGRQRVKTYFRKDGSLVAGHYKYVHALPGKFFIKRAVDQAFLRLNDEFDTQLRARFKNVVRK